MHKRLSAITAVIAMLIIAGLAWRPAPGQHIPPPLPLTDAMPWMADVLPGVGPKSREQVTVYLREERINEIPTRARDMAKVLFVWPLPVE
jgi:hypothetical protein